LALIRGELGSVYHLASDQGIAVRDVVEKICRMMGHDFAKATEDVPHLHGAENTFLLNSDRARARLGWRPEIDLDRGLGDVVRWIEANWAEIRGLPHDYIHQP
jgi:dTDP-glucose 4,6-dehydratase